jgi:hypothetical protein
MKNRVVRTDDELWAAAVKRAAQLGFGVGEFVRRCIQHGIESTDAAVRDPYEPVTVTYVPGGVGFDPDNPSKKIMEEHGITWRQE